MTGKPLSDADYLAHDATGLAELVRLPAREWALA